MAQAGTAGAPAAFDARRAGVSVAAGPRAAAPASAPAAPDGQQPIDAARLRMAIVRLSRRLRRHQLAGLTATQVSALSTIDQSGPLRLSDLAAVEGVAPSTLTRLVAALEERGYVQRAAVAGDARASEVAITARGREVLDRIRQESTTALAGSLALLDPGELAALAAALPALERLGDVDPR